MRIIVVLLILTLTACGGSRSVVPVGSFGEKVNKSSSTSATIYKVRKGDTLYSISFRYGLDYKSVAKINNIRSPYNIYVGQKLRLKAKKYSSKQSKKLKVANVTKKKTYKTKPKVKTQKRTKVASTANRSLKWRWPTRGKVISTYSSSAAGRKGIDISGKYGQNIIAAASGKVVYSGNGLPRYGNLLIIKHNDVYLSAYAHNKSLLVKEGQYVKSGQKVATLGKSGTQRYQLHFEIRRNGKPIDPLRFLPKR